MKRFELVDQAPQRSDRRQPSRRVLTLRCCCQRRHARHGCQPKLTLLGRQPRLTATSVRVGNAHAVVRSATRPRWQRCSATPTSRSAGAASAGCAATPAGSSPPQTLPVADMNEAVAFYEAAGFESPPLRRRVRLRQPRRRERLRPRPHRPARPSRQPRRLLRHRPRRRGLARPLLRPRSDRDRRRGHAIGDARVQPHRPQAATTSASAAAPGSSSFE